MSSFEQLTKTQPQLPDAFIGHKGSGTPTFQPPSRLTPLNSLNEILAYARYNKASDVHLTAERPVIIRQSGTLKEITAEKLSATQVHMLMNTELPKNIMTEFEAAGDLEYVHTITGYGRFRITLIKQRNGYDLTARVIPMTIPKIADIGMPASCANLTKWAQGLVLISGPAGCGKSTSLAALVEMINQTRNDHIITIEQPIEIIYEPKMCQITQREVNTHTLTQENALRAALREDPDILVVSELRDLATIQLAISASETGHLVLATMNTVNAAQTVSRLVDSFPSEEQTVIRKMISESLRGVICQQLIPKKDGTGLVAAYEVLTVNQSVANMIREEKISQLHNVIATGKSFGMVLMDTSLENLINNDTITIETARERATNPNNLLKELSP